MKILLIGPYPPPHGGVSVHVLEAHRRLCAAGVECRVLDTERSRPAWWGGPPGPALGPAGKRGKKAGQGAGRGPGGPPHQAKAVAPRVRRWGKLMCAVLAHARRGWTVHLHTNGHNTKSWLVAAACGLAARSDGGSLLTLHSGMTPGYLNQTGAWRRLARFACSLYTRIVCVSPGIQRALASLGVPPDRTEILPAYLGSNPSHASLDAELLLWLEGHRPVLSTALFFRPEYGFDLLVDALVRLRRSHPALGCVVMGSGEQQAQAKRRVRETGLAECVLFAGDVDHDTCLALMSASDVFVRPTLEDGDSVSVREALAVGTSVVASATGMRPSGVLLFQPGSVEEMISKLELAISAPRGREAPPEDSGARLMEIYRQLAAPTEVYAAA